MGRSVGEEFQFQSTAFIGDFHGGIVFHLDGGLSSDEERLHDRLGAIGNQHDHPAVRFDNCAGLNTDGAGRCIRFQNLRLDTIGGHGLNSDIIAFRNNRIVDIPRRIRRHYNQIGLVKSN